MICWMLLGETCQGELDLWIDSFMVKIGRKMGCENTQENGFCVQDDAIVVANSFACKSCEANLVMNRTSDIDDY